MEVREALKEFGLVSLENVTKDSLKRVYRSKMKLEHPDLTDGKSTKRAQIINEAYETVLKLVEEVSNFRLAEEAKAEDNKLYVISLEDLQIIYSGHSVSAINSSDIVDTAFLHRKRMALNVAIRVEFKGAVTESSQFISWNISDNYSVDIHINDFNIDTGGELKVSIGEHTKNISISTERRISLLYNLGHNVRLKVLIERWNTDGQGNPSGANRGLS